MRKVGFSWGNIDRRKSNPENSSVKKVGQHVSLCFPMSTISSFKSIENKHEDKGKVKYYMKKSWTRSGDN